MQLMMFLHPAEPKQDSVVLVRLLEAPLESPNIRRDPVSLSTSTKLPVFNG